MEDPREAERRHIERHMSGRHLLDVACGVHILIISEGRSRPTRKKMFLTGASWSAMIRHQASEQHLVHRLYMRNGAIVDGYGRKLEQTELEALQIVHKNGYSLQPFSTIQPGVA